MRLTQNRVYVFVFFNSIYAFLPSWSVANMSVSLPAVLTGICAYIAVIFANLGVVKWLADREGSDGDVVSAGFDRMMLARLLMGHFVIILSCILGLGKARLIAQEHYGSFETWQVAVSLLFFAGAYFGSFLFTLVQLDPVSFKLPQYKRKDPAPVPVVQVKSVPSETHIIEKKKVVTAKDSEPKPRPPPRVEKPDVFLDLVPDAMVRSRAFMVLRRTPDWINVWPPDELCEKKGRAFFHQAVIRALGDAGDPAAVPFLAELLGKTYDLSHGKEAFHRPHWMNMGVDATSALARIGAPSVEALCKALRSADRLFRLYAVCGIALLRNPSLRPALAEAAQKETDSVVRIYLERALTQLDRKEFIPGGLSSLKLNIEPALVKIRVGEPIRFFWSLRNESSEPMVVNTNPVKVVKQIFLVKPLKDPMSAFPTPYDSDSAPGKNDLLTLAPGEIYRTGPFDLREAFNFIKPGPYEIQGVYRNRFPGIEYGVYAMEGRLSSQPVVIELSAF